jgi:hypothetical protein
MNKLISRYILKDRTFSQSMSLASRVCLAVGVDSVGHEEYYEHILAEMGVKLPENMRVVLGRMTKQREYDQKYQSLPKRKRKRANLKFAKMKDELKKQMADEAMGLNYETGLSMQEMGDDADVGPNRKKQAVLCKFCGSWKHKTRRSKECKYFGWPNDLVEAEMVRVNNLQAREKTAGQAMTKESSEVQSDGTCNFFMLCDSGHTTFLR